MIRWFGAEWKGDICKEFIRAENPGGRCVFCGQRISRTARGFILDEMRACHKKCLSRSIVGKSWVDHRWTTKMHSLWTRGWTCKRCGVVVFSDPDTEEGRKKNAYDRKVTRDCMAYLVDAVSKL